MRIAITGGIGSGKSFVCRQLEQLYGIEVFNCDIVAKYIIATHPNVRQALTDLIASELPAPKTKPTAQATVPAAQATKPTAQATVPAAQATKPAAQATKPTAQATKPTAQATVPEASASVPPVLTKEALGAYIRRGPDYAARVNAIVHPRVAEAFELYCKQPPKAPALAVRNKDTHWMECAILFESGFDHLVDRVIVVTCPTDERIRRIVERDKCSADTARRWIELQLSDEERIAQAAAHNAAAGITAPFAIVNDGSTQLRQQLDALIASLS